MLPRQAFVVDALQRRHLDDVLAVMREITQGGQPLTQLVDDLVRSMIAAHSIQPALHQVLLDEVPGNARTRETPRPSGGEGHTFASGGCGRGVRAGGAIDQRLRRRP